MTEGKPRESDELKKHSKNLGNRRLQGHSPGDSFLPLERDVLAKAPRMGLSF